MGKSLWTKKISNEPDEIFFFWLSFKIAYETYEKNDINNNKNDDDYTK